MNQSIPHTERQRTGFASINWSVWCVVALLSFQPVSNDNLWWNLSQGRAVLQGELYPSINLLNTETEGDADWLSGVIPYSLYASLGSSGLMLFKIVMAVCLGGLLVRKIGHSWSDVPVVLIALLAAEPAFDPSPRTYDLLGILLAWNLARNRQYKWLIPITILWANLSLGAVWCLPVFVASYWSVSHMNQQGRSLMAPLIGFCSLAAALCLTPRGVFIFHDIAIFLVPALYYQPVFLSGTNHGSLQFAQINTGHIAAIVIWLIVMIRIIASRSSPAEVLVLMGMIVLGWLSIYHIPAAALVSALFVFNVKDHKHEEAKRPLLKWELQLPVFIGVMIVSTGGWNRQGERLGWGIADRIDIRMLERDLQDVRSRLIAHCTDQRSSAMLCFAGFPNVRLDDATQRAILSNRLQEQMLTSYDLRSGRKAFYHRSNKSTGGWWLSLIGRNISLLAVPASDVEMVRSLEPTLWKPLSLDSPILLFAKAGDPIFNDRILRTQLQRSFVNDDNWQHSALQDSTEQWHLDGWKLITQKMDYRPDIRQARVFRAMGLHHAALRTLFPLLQDSQSRLSREEFAQCQKELAWLEWRECGLVSELRHRAYLIATGGKVHASKSGKSTPSDEWALDIKNIMNHEKNLSEQCFELYLQGKPLEAAETISGTNPESLYAKAMLSWEGGAMPQTDSLLQHLRESFPNHPLATMSGVLRDDTQISQ